jgi:hypothetical protein
VLRFKQFLDEALHHGTVTLAGSGSDGDRHVARDIVPHIGAEQPTHVTAGHGSFAAGTELHVHGFHKDDKGKIHIHVSDVHGNKGHIPSSRIYKPSTDLGYNDEHATKHVWNRMVGKGMAHDMDKMRADLHDAKTNKSHPLHFDKAPSEGFLGKKKTEKHKEAYHRELATAAETVHALANHPDFKESVKQKHTAEVQGGKRGSVSDTWKKHGATDRGGISKADIAIGPKGKEHNGIKLSLKKGGGSQLASPGPEEASAIHDHAATHMLANEKKYHNYSAKQKQDIHSEIMGHIAKMAHHMNAARGKEGEELQHHKREAGKHLSAVHEAHPELNHYVRHEATTGQGKFGKGSAHAAQHIVIGASKKEGAVVKNVDHMDHSGSQPTISKGKKLGPNTPLTMRLKS